MDRSGEGGGVVVGVPNIIISDVKITPNSVYTSEKFVISVTITPETFCITALDNTQITGLDGNMIASKEE